MPGAPAKTWPEIVVTLKGPLDSPQRTIDVSAFTSWLALREVEQQSKKLDVLEGGEAASGATADPPGPGRPLAPGRRQPRRVGVSGRRGRRRPGTGIGVRRGQHDAERGSRSVVQSDVGAISPLISPLRDTSPGTPG
jgi:hypothetical protein